MTPIRCVFVGFCIVAVLGVLASAQAIRPAGASVGGAWQKATVSDEMAGTTYVVFRLPGSTDTARPHGQPEIEVLCTGKGKTKSIFLSTGGVIVDSRPLYFGLGQAPVEMRIESGSRDGARAERRVEMWTVTRDFQSMKLSPRTAKKLLSARRVLIEFDAFGGESVLDTFAPQGLDWASFQSACGKELIPKEAKEQSAGHPTA